VARARSERIDRHPCHRLIAFRDARPICTVDGAAIPVAAGDALLLLPGQSATLRIGPDVFGMWIDFDAAWRPRDRIPDGARWVPADRRGAPADVLTDLWRAPVPARITGGAGADAHLMLAEVGDLWWRSPGEHLLANARLAAWLARLFQTVVEGQSPPLAEPWGAIRTWAERRLEHGVRVEDMAAQAGLDRTTFTRRWQAACGTTPGAFLHDLRLHRAAALVQEGRLDLGQVALHCGWRSRSAFDAAFRARFGLAPRRWREAWRDSWRSRSAQGDVAQRIVEPEVRPK
jgi:AraC-like DNA-binding protein